MSISTEYHSDGRSFTINRTQDVEPILERNKELQSVAQKSDWGRHIASVPNIFLEKWLNEELARGNTTIQFGNEEFWQLVERKLQDPDWKFLRTDSAQVQGFMGFGG